MSFRCPLILAVLFATATIQVQSADEAPSLVQKAGNTDDDHERQVVLEKLAALPSVNEAQRKEAASLAAFVRQWNGSNLKFYGASVRGKPHRAIAEYDFGVGIDSPLRPICDLYRGRMLAWTLIENSTVRTSPTDSSPPSCSILERGHAR